MPNRNPQSQQYRRQVENPTRGTSILRRPESAQLFFVYPGKRRAIAGVNPMFLLRAGLGDRNIAFVRDPSARAFEQGIDETLPTFESVVDWHKAHINSLDGLREVYTVGNSGGGYASLMFGHLLGVKAVYAFCPRGPNRGPKLRRLLSEWNGVTEYHVYYSELDYWDKDFAERLSHLPHLALHPSDPKHRDDHSIMGQMARRGDLSAVFPPPLGVPG